MNITPAQRSAIETFVQGLEKTYTLEQLLASGQLWAKDSTIWRHIRQSASGQLKLICWYNNTHQPGGKEWRPAVIILAVLSHIGQPHTTGHLPTKQIYNATHNANY